MPLNDCVMSLLWYGCQCDDSELPLHWMNTWYKCHAAELQYCIVPCHWTISCSSLHGLNERCHFLGTELVHFANDTALNDCMFGPALSDCMMLLLYLGTEGLLGVILNALQDWMAPLSGAEWCHFHYAEKSRCCLIGIDGLLVVVIMAQKDWMVPCHGMK